MVRYCTDSISKGGMHKAQHMTQFGHCYNCLTMMFAMFKRAYLYCSCAKFCSLYKKQIFSYCILTEFVQCDDLEVYCVSAYFKIWAGSQASCGPSRFL